MNESDSSSQAEVWPPQDEYVALASIASHHVRAHYDQVTGVDRMGPVTVGQHLVPLVDGVLETAMRETAGRGADVKIHFDFIDNDHPGNGVKLGVAYDGEGPSPEAFEDETTDLARLRRQAVEAGGSLALTQYDEDSTPRIELTFPFWPSQD